MKLIKKGDLNILTPEDGFELVNKNTGICSDKVYLGKSDSLDNYIERKKENYIADLSILKEQKDIEIHILMDVIDSLILLLEPVITSIPFAISNSSNTPMDKIILFYAKMIEMNLKSLEEVPSSFRDLVSEYIN
jgi:hypothetical protein